jgi:hypothetical protein
MTPALVPYLWLGGVFVLCVGALEILRAAARVIRRMFR